jgi:hypothetical protein
MDVMERIAGMPRWSKEVEANPYSSNLLGAIAMRGASRKERDLIAALARLALAREWIAEANHHDGCECLYYVASSEMWFASDSKPCNCGRDALLAALEVPK